jgi:biopolymer transport protein ExbB
MNRRIAWIGLGCLVLGSVVFGAEEDLCARLNRAIALTEQELAAERERITRELAVQQEALDRALAEQKQRTDDYVDRKLALAQMQTEWQARQAEHLDIREQLNESRQRHAVLDQLCRQGLDLLQTHLASLPPSEARAQQQVYLNSGRHALTQAALPDTVDALLNLSRAVLQESRTCAEFEASILDARGETQTARLLRIGQIFTAYSLPASGRLGLAYRSPPGQTGFRWSESLPSPVRAQLKHAFLRPPNTSVALPLDVTQRMVAPVSNSEVSLLGRLQSGGMVMVPLGLVALLLLVLIFERSVSLGREGYGTAAWCTRVQQACQAGQNDTVGELARGRRGMMGRILQVCLNHRSRPGAELDDALQEAFLYEFPRLERGLSSIRTLASLAPMLGLLGTVTGIITTFDMISVMGGGKPRLMAGGISEALVTTATGLIIAIPALLACSVLSARVERLISNAESFAATLTNLFKQEGEARTIPTLDPTQETSHDSPPNPVR